MRPRLARHVRVREDRASGRPLLLAPERGILLSPSAAMIVRLCDGARTREEIVDALVAAHRPEDRAKIEADVDAVISALSRRALMERT